MENYQTLRDDFLFTDMIEVPTNGRSGGIVLIWSSRLITIDIISFTSQEIHAMVKVYSSTQPWLFSAIYASNLFNYRKILWDNLITLHETYSGPWLIGGDFNEVLTANDKWGGFKGSEYTWSNKKTRDDLILERLYRCFINDDWLNIFPDAHVSHLPKTYSDHNPLLLHLHGNNITSISKPFRFETMWYSHLDLVNIINDSWNSTLDLLQATSLFQYNITWWNKHVFGNIFTKTKTILARLTGLPNSAKYATRLFLQNLEISLIKDFNDILRLEEELWKLKSRINWITDGDANTKFFYISTINRRRRNRIISFIDDTGNLIYDQADIEAHIFHNFKALYSTVHLDAANHYNHYPFPILTDSDIIHLGKNLCDHEILEALKSFKPFKAPRLDSLHPFFYKKY
ncbi:uncharacterized protein LOC142173689 [Nicotiana tabacum]|uniref:Uncharacterized protein LOC142173689 n=1 Tax=Nicotiana tabacum TaxID=4097 RepID=A0AC58TDU9_TOBAC